MTRTIVLLVLLAGAVASTGYWWLRGQPVVLADLPSDRLACVSYAPFRKPGQSPFIQGIVIPPAQIEDDLRALSRHIPCVRTYSVDQGLAEVPRIARKLGMKVYLGVWIGRSPKENDAEIARALRVLERDADVIAAVIVGNEVLLRREQPPAGLARYIERIRSATSVPVTYADVWEFWIRNPALAKSVSFVTVHMLPYWEDHPVPVANAVGHIFHVYGEVKKAFPDQEVIIGEAGWPSVGRTREGSVPSRVNAARFVREFALEADRRGVRYNLIEAFDQPWKRRLEGSVGGHWGLYDSALREKFSLRGPVIEDQGWIVGVNAGVAGAIAFLALAVLRGSRPRELGAATLVLAGFGTGASFAAAAQMMILGSRNTLEWTANGFFAVTTLAATFAIANALARWLDRREPVAVPAPWLSVVEYLKTDRCAFSPREVWLGALRFTVLFGVAGVTLLLAVDPRYRDFPIALFAPPAVGFALLALADRREHRPATGDIRLEEILLSAATLAGAPVILARETLANVHALWWVALIAALSAAVLLPWLARRRSGL